MRCQFGQGCELGRCFSCLSAAHLKGDMTKREGITVIWVLRRARVECKIVELQRLQRSAPDHCLTSDDTILPVTFFWGGIRMAFLLPNHRWFDLAKRQKLQRQSRTSGRSYLPYNWLQKNSVWWRSKITRASRCMAYALWRWSISIWNWPHRW